MPKKSPRQPVIQLFVPSCDLPRSTPTERSQVAFDAGLCCLTIPVVNTHHQIFSTLLTVSPSFSSRIRASRAGAR
jgi:hypothetical protein